MRRGRGRKQKFDLPVPAISDLVLRPATFRHLSSSCIMVWCTRGSTSQGFAMSLLISRRASHSTKSTSTCQATSKHVPHITSAMIVRHIVCSDCLTNLDGMACCREAGRKPWRWRRSVTVCSRCTECVYRRRSLK